MSFVGRGRRTGSGRHFLEHLQADLAFGDFAQGGHARLVLALDLGGMALAEHARTVGRGQHELKTVGDLLQAVFDGDACHGGLRAVSGDVERFEGIASGAALRRVLQALGVNDGLEIKQGPLE